MKHTCKYIHKKFSKFEPQLALSLQSTNKALAHRRYGKRRASPAGPAERAARSCSESWRDADFQETRDGHFGKTNQKKKTGLEKTSAIPNAAKIQMLDALNDTLDKLNHKFPAAVHAAHQKPTPALEKATPLKRAYIIQQPRK